MLAAGGIKIQASRSGEMVELYIVVLVAHYRSPCLPHRYVYPFRTLPHSLSTTQICLSLSHAVALFAARMSVLISRYRSPCLLRLYLCPCRTLVLSLSNDARQRRQQCATRISFDLLKKNSTFYIDVFLGRNTYRKKAGNLFIRRHIKKFANYSS